MGTISANFFMSLDGVVESPNLFVFPYFSDEVGAAVSASTEQSRAMIMGRQLYAEWSAYWPTAEDPFGGFINQVDKYVISDSLTTADWNATTIIPGAEAEQQVRALKERTDGVIGVSGSGTTVAWLATHRLLDELRLLVFPVAVGQGRRLFEDGRVPLALTGSRSLDTGVVELVYAPAP
ncbi:dihydrofolate reductase [Friedmanniella endophytica]|uniref:Dihydrofolate reductase n=1 Tax=Microlunatus kandeliicorticis TaxID=1759536 RepID=A0A7W3IP60_9ACTN|nr:dihydrofolate reductase family protein [Microlunatus kandeliicorticis]MBA8792656.1 dihydrofolate reductase [Microlunatus kandeliicorticis]